MRILYGPEAEADIVRLVRWSGKRFGAAQTRTYVAGLREAIARLRDMPEIAPPVSHGDRAYRRLVHRSHVVYSMPLSDHIRIVRVFHMRQDPQRHL